jgi:phosphoglycerate kinase
MANTLLAANGYGVGSSKIESDKLDIAREIISKLESGPCKAVFPEDLVVADQFSADAAKKTVPYDQVPADWMALDIGPATAKAWAEIFAKAGTIVWNGPLGVYEMPAFAEGSDAVAKAMAESPAITIVGGGDAVAAVMQAGYGDKMTHLSTGGGASLELLEGKKLPGIEILQEK